MRSELTPLRNELQSKSVKKILEFCELLENTCLKIKPSESYLLKDVLRDIGLEIESDVQIQGSEIVEELSEFCDKITEDANISQNHLTKFYTPEQLSTRLAVSSRTIYRWRKMGLLSRRYYSGSRIKTAFLETTVDKFSDNNAELIEEGAKFSVLTPLERLEVVDMSVRLLRAGIPRPKHSKIIGKSLDKSASTIRPLISELPNEDILRDRIYSDYKKGETPELIREKYALTKKLYSEIIDESTKEFYDSLDLRYKEDGTTHSGHLRRKISDEKLLTNEDEIILFRQMNYYKKKASEQRDLGNYKKLEHYWKKAEEVRNKIWVKNRGLAYSHARNYKYNYEEIAAVGVEALEAAINGFEYYSGNKFSTYAITSIRNSVYKTVLKDKKVSDNQVRQEFNVLDSKESLFQEAMVEDLEVLRRAIAVLSDREKDIVFKRYGLDMEGSKTLKEIGEELGISKERVRQIEERGINKIKKYFKELHLDATDFFWR